MFESVSTTMLKDLALENGFRCWGVETLSDFADFVANESFPERTIFRGQRRDDPLLPAIARSPRQYRSRDAWEILNSFKREPRPWVEPVDWTDWDWIVTARHHGVPTRLLDFTTNPLAALWFAVEERDDKADDAVVWAARYKEDDKVRNERTFGPFAQR